MVQILFVNALSLWFDVRIFYVANLSSVDPGSGIHFVLDRAQHLALPVIVLMVANIATYSRSMPRCSRSSTRLRSHRAGEGAQRAPRHDGALVPEC